MDAKIVQIINEDKPAEYNGKPATMILVNTMGFPVARQIKLNTVITAAKSVTVFYTPKGQRREVGVKFNVAEADVTIVEGFYDIKTPDTFTVFEDGAVAQMVAQTNGAAVIQRIGK